MDTRLPACIIISLIIGTGLGYVITQSQLTAIQSTLNQVQSEAEKVTGLQQQINQLATEKQSLQQQVNALQSQINSASSEKTSLQTQLNNLNIQITSKDTLITNLNQQIIQIESQSNYELIGVSFSRTQDTSTLLSQWIGKANQTIQLMLYFITQDQLTDSLIAAKNRGVDVDIVVDEYCLTVTGSEYQRLLSAGIDIRSDNYSGTMHHKVMIVDGSVVATGSYNWSSTAEDSNYENMIIFRDTDIANLYVSEFNRIWSITSKGTQIESIQLTASFTYSVNGLVATFTDASKDDVGVVSWNWSFGDASTSTIKNPSHTYTTSGTYTVTLTVRDADSHSSTASHSVTVTSSQPANGPFWGSKNSNKYHYPSCYWAQQINANNLITFSSSTQARAAGYVPCSVCNPP